MINQINKYIKNNGDTFQIEDEHINRLPEIMSTFNNIKNLKIKNCSLMFLNMLPPNIVKLNAYNNMLTTLTNDLPTTLNKLNVSRNIITHVDLSLCVNLTILNISHNPIDNSILFPPNLTQLDISNTKFNIIPQCAINQMHNLKKLNIDQCMIETLDYLPSSINTLSTSQAKTGPNNKIIISDLKNINTFICNNSNIQFNFTHFPQSLIHLSIYNCSLTEVPFFPLNMDVLDISNNNLSRVPNVPDYVKLFDCSNNDIIFTETQNDTIKLLQSMNATVILNTSHDNVFDDNDIPPQYTAELEDMERTLLFGSTNTFNHEIKSSEPETKTHMFNPISRSHTNATPNYIMRLMAPDNFTPTKTRRIKHYHIYEI